MDIQGFARLLTERDDFLILTHRRPDGDTLGSAAALCHGLRRLGKTAQLYRNPEITETYLPFVSDTLAPAGYAGACTIAVDIADPRMFPKGFSGAADLSLDHHATGGAVAPLSLTDPGRAACGELVMELLTLLLGGVSKTEADLLYMAVSTDTGCFCYANVTAATFSAAARLKEAGADTARLNKLLFRTKSRQRILLEGLICADLRSYHNDAINIAVVTLDMLRRSAATEDDCDDLASLAGCVRGNRVSITVRELSEDPPESKISLRTDGSVDASQVCARFGGGGHRMASGCELPCPPEAAAETIRQAVEAAWA